MLLQGYLSLGADLSSGSEEHRSSNVASRLAKRDSRRTSALVYLGSCRERHACARLNVCRLTRQEVVPPAFTVHIANERGHQSDMPERQHRPVLSVSWNSSRVLLHSDRLVCCMHLQTTAEGRVRMSTRRVMFSSSPVKPRTSAARRRCAFHRGWPPSRKPMQRGQRVKHLVA